MIWYLVIILGGGILLYAVVLGAAPTSKGSRRTNGRKINPSEFRPRWETIMVTSRSGATGLKNSIMEADKLLDYAMKSKGYPGETMGERLKIAGKDLSNRDAVWRAHKLRNSLAHEMGFDLVVSQANEALRDFERALKDLGAL